MNNAEKQVAAASLRNEATVIRQTRENYKEARANIEEKIRVLSEREQTQSVIWQKQYQEALKEQLDTAINTLSEKNYSNIHQYLEGEYEDGFIGAMYSLQKQGIPLALPIDQRRVVKMVETGADGIKLSKRLYGNSTKLKNAVRREISIGLASGESYEQVAGRLSRTMDIDYNKAIRIARTEGGRVGSASSFDAMVAAKKAGADVVKQWDATLDSRTRKAHMELNGQIRELEEPFEGAGQKAMHPHGFGVPWMDINCRCHILQRARWMVESDDPEMQSYTKWDRSQPIRISEDGKSISQIADFSDAKNFADFKARYKQVASNLTQQLATAAIGVEVMGETKKSAELLNAKGEKIAINLEAFTLEQQEYVIERLSVLSEKYTVPYLVEVTTSGSQVLGAFSVGGVEEYGTSMYLRVPSAVDHEFMHAIDMSNRSKYGQESNKAFWKEARKLFKEYKRDISFDITNLISSYSETNVDEFMAEAFSVGVGGDSAGIGHGAESPYVEKAMKLIDKYFAKKK